MKWLIKKVKIWPNFKAGLGELLARVCDVKGAHLRPL